MALQLLTQIAAFTGFGPKLLDKFYDLLSDHGLSSAGSYLFSFGNVEPEVEKLQHTYNRIQALLKDADERRYIEDAAVKLWLRALRDVHFDADDILDEFRTFLAVSKLNQELKSKKRKRQWYGFFMSLFPSWSPSPMCKRRRIKGRIGEIREKLDAISEDREKLRLKPEDGKRKPDQSREKQLWMPTSSLQDESRVLGREDDLSVIIARLKDNNGDDIEVVPIYGIGGLGKTTLAQQAFGHLEIKEHFRLRIWVSMRKDFDVERTTKEIIEVITRKKCDALSFEVLQNLLLGLLERKRFLLVLDNLWREDSSFWEALKVPLVLARSKGSKLLVTTRSRIVCNIMSREPPILLKGLNFESCWLLFKERAFAPGQAEDPNLVAIGSQIVEKCQGLPMVVKLLGCLLHSITEEDEWNSVQREIRGVEEGEDSILQTLKVSYDQLPLHLKHCFAYCSVFPVEHEFDKDELVKLWMAEGLIPPRGNRRPEAVGDRCFNYLLWRSFFQVSVDCHQLNVKYKMPTVIHDLAQSVSSGEFLRVEHNERQGGDDKVRFAFCSLNPSNPIAFSQMCQSESLRTLFLHINSGTFSKQVMAFLLPRFRCLRVLDLRNNQLEQLPNSIGDLTHLRYLSLYNTQIKCLPESVSSLYNLQTLNLGECYKLVELPEGFHKLVNLRHLNLEIDWDKWTDLNSMPPGISDLKSLQTMSRFVVAKKSGCGIRELKDLKLRGELCISKLENVEKIDDAKEAELQNKQYLEKLMLQWSPATNSNRQNSLPAEELIKYLQPHNRLKHLRIDLYDGTQFPQWLAERSFSSLESITLSNCRICTVLPAIDQLPNLRNLVLKDCEKLTAIPHLHNIQTLVVEGCNKSAFSMLSGLTSLSSLTISRCGDIQVQKSSFQQLSSLKKLKIEECNKLISVAPEEDLRNLTCLESLEISSCQELVSFADMGLPPSLTSLQLHCCEKLDNFPIQLHLITPRLHTLTLSRCSLLEGKLQSDGDYLAHINVRNI
ncbi:hypothetical protein J5N97_014591 [Dioscorea zingiberensis]|uniref:Uncharacterized protein n=1 Tax=Dioscorea zingiberensis TaxID=325984 RepID=A0A9D5CU93_9LILI|nr:hypothetical protein J5N97_014591 [Dioscorea zingiberensis]